MQTQQLGFWPTAAADTYLLGPPSAGWVTGAAGGIAAASSSGGIGSVLLGSQLGTARLRG